MNFYRHWYNRNETRYNMLADISSLGFYDTATNEPYDGVGWVGWQSTDIKPNALKNLPEDLYWYKDSTHKCTLKSYLYGPSAASSLYYWGAYLRVSPSSKDTHATHESSAGQYCTMFNSFNGNYPESSDANTAEVFFMPLKDGGFLLNNKLPTYYGGWNYTETGKSTFQMKIMPFTYEEGIPEAIGSQNTDQGYSPWYNTFIGVPPTNKSTVSNYIYIFSCYKRYQYDYVWRPIFSSHRNDTQTQKDLTPYFDLQTGTSMRSNFFKMHNKYYYSSDSDVNKQYMNFIPNVCVLSKVPYDNGFIDNIYYMTTCPTASISDDNYRGIFFSFAGRNFINIYGNMVLELPSY